MRESGSSRQWFVVATLVLGLYTMLCVFLPWAHGSRFDRDGIVRTSFAGYSYSQGVVVFAGALGLVSVSALRVTRRISDLPYLSLGAAACLLSLTASVWFWSSEIGVVDPEWTGEVFSGVLPRISAGNGWQGTTAALVIGLICFLGFATDAVARLSEFRLVLDRRTLAGGSLIPNRIRVRIVRRGQQAS